MVSVLVLTPAVTLITPHRQYFALLSTRSLISNLICVVVSSSGLFFDAYLLLGFKVKSYSPSAFIVRNLPVEKNTPAHKKHPVTASHLLSCLSSIGLTLFDSGFNDFV